MGNIHIGQRPRRDCCGLVVDVAERDTDSFCRQGQRDGGAQAAAPAHDSGHPTGEPRPLVK
jgi:hypothetical protein